MRPPSLFQRSRAVGGCADKWMAKPDPGAELAKSLLHSRVRRFGADPLQPGSAPDQDRVSERLGCRDYKQPPGLERQPYDPATKALLDPMR